MSENSSLIRAIREEFGSVKFPSHCGLYAAVAMDDWIEDEVKIREITRSKDYQGEWWNVPEKHLLECMKALSYLDGAGIEFYLPAYMTAIVKNPLAFDEPHVRSSSWQILFTMIPNDGSDPELVQYFFEQFSQINGGKKQVCRMFMQYVVISKIYDNHAIEIAKEGLANEFWSASS